jgi:hypothetical protein
MRIPRTSRLAGLLAIAAVTLTACMPPAPPAAEQSGPPPSTSGATVTSIAPTRGFQLGGDAFNLVGVGFAGATQVMFGDTPADFVVDSDESISGQVPAHAPGAVIVTVTTPQGTSTEAIEYTYVPVADLGSSVQWQEIPSDDSLEILANARNFGPSDVTDTELTFTIEQSAGATLLAEPLVDGSYTSGSCTMFGDPTQAGSWGMTCSHLAMAFDQDIRLVVRVTYASPASITACSSVWDAAMEDTTPDNNKGSAAIS